MVQKLPLKDEWLNSLKHWTLSPSRVLAGNEARLWPQIDYFNVMDIDEREIFLFLKTYGSDFVSAREICRRAGGKKRYHEDHEWAKPIVIRMTERGILESNSEGQYRVKPTPKKKGGRWVSPDIAKILKESGVEPDSAAPGQDEIAADEYYEQL